MRTSTFLVVGYILIAVGALFLIAGGVVFFRQRHKIASWVSATGSVTDVELRWTSSGDSLFYPVVEFSTEDGVRVRFESDIGFYPQEHYAGQILTVLYDPVNPQDAIIDTLASRYLAPAILAFIGVVALAVGAMLIRFAPTAPG